jgi:hypothetical protein
MKKYLISYGDKKYALQKEFFEETAQSSGFFDVIKIFSPEDVSDKYKSQVGDIINESIGGGYWLWKPYIIKTMLDEIEFDDILIYCDCGCFINPAAGKRFDEYIELVKAATSGTVDFELSLSEYEFTKKEVFDYFDADDHIINSNQLMATVLIFRKCKPSMELVDEWYNTAIAAPFLFNNVLTMRQHFEFSACRNDQSVFSVIRKKLGGNPIPDETYFLDFIREGQDYPFWAARLK